LSLTRSPRFSLRKSEAARAAWSAEAGWSASVARTGSSGTRSPVDLTQDDLETVPLKAWFTGVRNLMLPRALGDADLVISMPKLETHHWAGMTCGMKNLFRVVPGAVYGWPKNFLHVHGIPESILDLTAGIRPGLTIVDAVVGRPCARMVLPLLRLADAFQSVNPPAPV
jgi:hypothetical protein